MTTQPDFYINSSGQISTEFVDRNILTFSQATLFVRQLPYGRNIDKNDLTSVFADNGFGYDFVAEKSAGFFPP